MQRTSKALVFLTLLSSQALAAETKLRPDQLAFRELYEELVETNTTLSSGSCTLAAERMAARHYHGRSPGNGQGAAQGDATAEMMSAMDRMHAEMNGIQVAGDIDRDFMARPRTAQAGRADRP